MTAQRDYAELKRRVGAAGLLGRQPAFYVASMAVNAVLLALCLVALARLRQPWARAVDAAALGLVFAQLGFHLHDAGHHQMFERAWRNRLVGFVTANLVLGVSFGWWMDEHTRHHANPNHMEMDPDVDNAAISYSVAQALRRTGVARLVARYQAFLILPLASLTVWSMQAQGVRFVLRERYRGRRLEAAALAAHAVLLTGLLVWLVGPPSALLVIAIQHAASGLYFSSVVLPNHQGMPQVGGGGERDFLRRQVVATRNVSSNWLTDLWFGSLNLQIEHHLFPRMTRANLRRARPIVRAYCRELGVAYHEVSVPRAYLELLRFLHEVGAPLRRPGAVELLDRRTLG